MEIEMMSLVYTVSSGSTQAVGMMYCKYVNANLFINSIRKIMLCKEQ